MKDIKAVGFWSGILAFIATISFFVVQLLQLFRVIRFPEDEVLIYSTSLCIVIPFLIEMLALHYSTTPIKKFWSHGALIFTIMYAVFVTANYVVQLVTVIPMKIKGLGNEVRLLDQYPHSLFWDFDALGYIFMGLAMLFAVPSFKKTGFQKYSRLAFLANAIVTPLICFVYFYPSYSENLLLIGLPWAITAPLAMLTLAIQFKKERYINQLTYSNIKVS